MLFRLFFEGAVGAVTLIAIVLFGERGFAAIALLALLPVIWRIRKTKPDERELQLFYQTNNWALGFTILAMLAIYELSHTAIGGNTTIGELWFPLSVSAILLGKGIAALFIFRLH